VLVQGTHVSFVSAKSKHEKKRGKSKTVLKPTHRKKNCCL
jgi:hypothetical protein